MGATIFNFRPSPLDFLSDPLLLRCMGAAIFCFRSDPLHVRRTGAAIFCIRTGPLHMRRMGAAIFCFRTGPLLVRRMGAAIFRFQTGALDLRRMGVAITGFRPQDATTRHFRYCAHHGGATNFGNLASDSRVQRRGAIIFSRPLSESGLLPHRLICRLHASIHLPRPISTAPARQVHHGHPGKWSSC